MADSRPGMLLKARFKDGKLSYDKNSLDKLKGLKKELKDGDKLDVLVTMANEDGSLAQLSKIHASMRNIASTTGSTFEEVKLGVKNRAGLIIGTNIKSFGDCSKEELMLVIETINDIGVELGMQL